jgi:protein FRA10AC1
MISRLTFTDPQFALRWRTEDEVLSGAGETTCGNTRCSHHVSTRFQNEGGNRVSLSTLELPFAYLEHGESKSALVKVVLCGRCVKKLMWKRTKEKEKEMSALIRDSRLPGNEDSKDALEINHEDKEIEKRRQKKRSREEEEEKERSSRKRRSSRSRSPRRHKEKANQ